MEIRASEYIVVRIMGGLGNQMFQAALVEALKKSGKRVFIDISNWEKDNVSHHNGYELDRVFGLRYEIAAANEISRYAYVSASFKDKLFRHIWGQKSTYLNETDFTCKEDVLKVNEGYLMGYWQNERYFFEIRDRIREIFTFQGIDHSDIEDEIDSNESVSVHIRRGDYLKFKDKYGGICDDDYYRRSMNYIREKVPNAKFYIFSDDKAYAQEFFTDGDITVVEGNTGEKSYYDMYYMSRCKHNIVANSTFSWWGAYLNPNEQKIIIRPSRYNNISNKDIFPDSWLVIN